MSQHTEPDLTILYGSQSGNAEYLAYTLSETAKQSGLDVALLPLNDALNEEALNWKRLLIVTATHDNGHMPDNAEAFWQWLQTCEPARFAGLPYAVLAIGDSMYDDFCKAGQDFDQRFAELGAVSMLERIDCDVDYDMSSPPWVKSLLATLPDIEPWAPAEAVAVDAAAAEQFVTAPEVWQTATLVSQRTLSGAGSAKHVVHFELEVPEGFTYLPGDSLEVLPVNDERLVAEWLAAFPAEQQVTIDGETFDLAQALSTQLELRIPHLGLINSLQAGIASSSAADRVQDLLDAGNRDEIDDWLWGRDVLDVVTELGFAGTAIQPIIDLMRPLQPRSYSISSSPSVAPSRLTLTASAVTYEARGRTHSGACTTYLEASTGKQLTVRRAPSRDFHLPNDDSPIIMIGPGVGIAPFRAFLEELACRGSASRTWLFFGDQHRATDLLYADELAAWQASGQLTELSLAFSRDQAEKHYVQHELIAHAAAVRAWVEAGAYIFICGDKNHMAHDVESALIEILGGPQNGDTALEALRSTGRYVKDVY